MAGSDPVPREVIANPKAERQRELSKLRSLLVETGTVYVATVGERRWLTDLYVMIDITGSLALAPLIEEGEIDDGEIDDGEYKLLLSKGFVKTNDHVLVDVPGTLQRFSDMGGWCPVRLAAAPYGITYREDVAILLYIEACLPGIPDGQYRVPVGMNAEKWQAWHEAYNNNPKENRRAVFESTVERPGQPLRILLEGKAGGTQGVVAYVQENHIPDGEHGEKDLRPRMQMNVDWKD